jgi:DNA-binding NarL/FixJ family response regulator
MAHGSSNREIADQLTIGVRTVETHVERILQKLGLTNRREAMLRVREELGESVVDVP